MHDVIVIGAGPAGITAGIYAARKRMDLLVIATDLGGQTNWTRNIENYTGFTLVTGCELVKRFKEHLQQFNVAIKEGERVTSIAKNGQVVTVTTNKASYEARTLVITTGMVHRKLNVSGEDRFRGKGVAYCATCDAPLFAGMDVAVAGGGNSAIDAALQLIKIANKVYVINRDGTFAADPILVERMRESGKVTVFHDARITEIRGERFVNGITIDHKGEQKELRVEGVMVEIGWTPASDFAGILDRNSHGEIIVNCGSETSVPGIFAAGDVTSVPAKQIIVACGEGAKAVLAAFRYINAETIVETQPASQQREIPAEAECKRQ